MVGSVCRGGYQGLAPIFLPSEIGRNKTVIWIYKKKNGYLSINFVAKSNKDYFVRPENYILLFSTYIKMIKNDKDGFLLIKVRNYLSFSHWNWNDCVVSL